MKLIFLYRVINKPLFFAYSSLFKYQTADTISRQNKIQQFDFLSMG